MNAPDITFKVAKRFHELRRRYFGVRIGIGIGIAMIALLSVWLLLTAGDYAWEWASNWRKVGLLFGSAAACAWFVGRMYTVIRDTRQRRFAAKLETSFEDFGQRIRTVLDTVDGRVSGPDEMLTALGHQTLGRWETLTPAQLIPSRKLAAAFVVCMAITTLVIGLFISGGDVRTAMLRALGQEIPYTTLTVSPGDARILEGSTVELSLGLAGRTNRDVMLRYREISNQEIAGDRVDQSGNEEEASPNEWIESDLLPAEPKEGEATDSRQAKFAAGMGKAKNPIEYQFVTSVGTTRVYRVDVQPLIEAKRTETRVVPPEYTRLEARSFGAADVTALEQSKVTVTIETNHPLGKAKLEIGAKPSKLQAVEIQAGDDPAQWAFELPSDDSLHWLFTGSGRDGTPMTPVKGRLRILRDKAPGIAWQDPPDEIRVHTLAELPMRIRVSDDYGIQESGIVFQLGGADEYVLTDWIAEESDSESPPKTRLPLEEILPLESLALSERDYISYYAYAVDNRASGPHRAESDVRYIDIRPLRQFYSEIEQDPNNGAGGRVIVQLNEIIRRQRFLINRTRKLLSSFNVDLAAQLGTIDRMVESQSELAGLVRFLAEFFVSRGNDDVEALNQAEAAMLQASDSLAAGSFDLALVQEEDALRALAEARRTLEIALLKNPTPQQQQAFRRLARQLRQKLRRERPETEKQLADTLQKIAAQQSQLGQMAARIQRNQNNPGGISGNSGKQNSNNLSSQGSSAANSVQNPGELDPKEQEQRQPGEQGTESPDSETKDGAQPDSDELGDGEKPKGGEDEADGDQGGAEPDGQSLAEQQEQLLSDQIDLLERVQDIQEELADRLADSPLMADRMKAAIEAMDELGTQAREQRFGEFAGNSEETADQLREIGIQLDALAAGEPVARVSAIRDMTTSLANMERQLSDQLTSDTQSGRTQANSKGQQESTDELSRQARRMQRRAETVEDLLKAPTDVGDVETSEVNDNLQRFIEENEFMEQLEQSRDAAEQIANQDPQDDASDRPGAASGDKAMERAVEYAQAARMLDDLYRQLVTPRMARLREIEKQANRLAQQLGEGGKSEEETPEAKSGLRKLQKELEEEGLSELAELLTEMDLTDEELKERMSGGTAATANGFDSFGSGNVAGRVLLVVAELRSRIQEMILLEISADRDAPVPSEYRDAVDRYFRVLAGEATTVDTKPSSANTIPSDSTQ